MMFVRRFPPPRNRYREKLQFAVFSSMVGWLRKLLSIAKGFLSSRFTLMSEYLSDVSLHAKWFCNVHIKVRIFCRFSYTHEKCQVIRLRLMNYDTIVSFQCH